MTNNMNKHNPIYYVTIFAIITNNYNIFSVNMSISTRSKRPSLDNLSSSLLDPIVQIAEFQKSKLPTQGQVIGRVYEVFESSSDFQDAISVVAIELHSHWTQRNVYPICVSLFKVESTLLWMGKTYVEARSDYMDTEPCGHMESRNDLNPPIVNIARDWI